jgi:hypothetical protein
MPCPTFARAAVGAALILCLQLVPARAQDARFVAQAGNDANNCGTPGTACRTLQRAHDIANAGDKIIVLDSGNPNTVTNPTVIITKSIAIVATGVHANLSMGAQAKITINGAPNDVVYLEGLALGRNTPTEASTGIVFNSGGRLHVRNCVIRGFGTAGIRIKTSGTSRTYISNCTISNGHHGVLVNPAGATTNLVFLDHVMIEGNSGHGIRAVGSKVVVRIGNSTISDNQRGLSAASNASILSFGNNAIHGNSANGAPTSTVSLK